jgi:MFS family permease
MSERSKVAAAAAQPDQPGPAAGGAPGPATGGPADPPPGSLWQNPDFLKFWFGETLSLFGTQVTILAVPLTAVQVLGAGPEQLGLLRFLQLVPYLLFGLLFGVWVDRTRRRPLMFGANAVRMVLIGLVPVLSALGVLHLAVLYVVTFGVGTAALLYDVSWMSYVPALVRDKRYLVEANAKLGTTLSAADAAGPGLSGALIAALTAPIAMAVDAFSYLLTLVSLRLIRAPEPPLPPPAAGRRRVGPELAEGMRWVFGNRYLRAVALVGCMCNFFISVNQPLLIFYALRDRAISAGVLGLILSTGAVGGILGALASRALTRRFPIGRVYLLSLALTFGAPILIPAASGPRLVVAAIFAVALFGSYTGVSVANVVIISLRQTVTPGPLLGRMNAAMRMLLFGGGAIGGLLGGLVGGAVGVHTALWASGIGSAVAFLPILLSPVGRLRELPPAPAEAG